MTRGAHVLYSLFSGDATAFLAFMTAAYQSYPTSSFPKYRMVSKWMEELGGFLLGILKSDHISSATSFPKYKKLQVKQLNLEPVVSNHNHF